ncbi:DUF2911 domain-containing protein [Mesonia aestuariivivens]|uniref:DUF2911 domain-containing protein n=1 Tax=Mesonia aestuariivivens TaxID=2796128 RepID=A0ABS6W2S1_9FLAO|nr:DUF2911 domain-containing protein [Mesonia aestuariivivens]MBW2962157.1 DUF2911 domain-containing protein [Mesonia aestuariivivens]
MKAVLSLFMIFSLLSVDIQAQDFSDLDKSPMDVAIIRNDDSSPMARVIYSRPKMRGREIFGELVPYSKVWRTGANEATELRIYNDMTIGGQTIPAGTYSLYTIPEKTEWTLILNKARNQWGAYEYDDSKDLLRIKAPARKAAAPIEDFSIAFQPIENGTNLLIGWENTFIEVPLQNAE